MFEDENGFNKHHPELQEDELFLTNIMPGRVIHGMEDLDAISWSTKRLGYIAYDISGNLIKGMLPVFVKTEEIRRAGKIHLFN